MKILSTLTTNYDEYGITSYFGIMHQSQLYWINCQKSETNPA